MDLAGVVSVSVRPPWRLPSGWDRAWILETPVCCTEQHPGAGLTLSSQRRGLAGSVPRSLQCHSALEVWAGAPQGQPSRAELAQEGRPRPLLKALTPFCS